MRCFLQRQVLVALFLSWVSVQLVLGRYLVASCDLPCRMPQPRAVRVGSLMHRTDKPVRAVQYMTVVHRCDEGSGCCKQDKICAVSKFEHVKASVFVIDKSENKSWETTFTFKNHTECSCQSREDIPK